MRGVTMAVIAVYSPKGGVGKTTISVDLSWRCSNSGAKTLLWDLDPQGGSGFILRATDRAFARDTIFFDRPDKVRSAISATDYENLSFLGMHRSLRNVSYNLLRFGPKHRMTDLVRSLKSGFDRVVLDCPPVQDEASDQIIQASDLMIVPIQASPLSGQVLRQVLEELDRRSLRKIPILPVFSMYDSRRSAHRQARDGWMAAFPIIPSASQIEQSAFRRAPVGTFARHCEASKAMDRLWRGIEIKLAELGKV